MKKSIVKIIHPKFTHLTAWISVILMCNVLSLQGQINADFFAPTTESCGNLQVVFIDQSTSVNSIIDWSWDLEVNTSSQQNPGVIFTNPGTYTICLTVTDVNGNSDTECKEDLITVFPNPVASFDMDVTNGCKPVTVNYTNTSTSENGVITNLLWDVGGSTGVVSTMDPDFSFSSDYSFAGNYNASLTVEDERGCKNTVNLPNAVEVTEILQPEISYSIENSCDLPWRVTFEIDNEIGGASYDWDFGNGSTFSGANPPEIIYDFSGIYDVTLAVENGECQDTFLFSQLINTASAATFSYSPESVCENGTVDFVDNSGVPAESVLWFFGDGFSSSETNPSHTYSSAGCYDVTLIRYVEGCIDTTMISCLLVHPTPEVNYTITNQNTCVIPIDVTLHGESISTGTFVWEFINGADTTIFNENDAVVQISNYGIYEASYTFTDVNGCTVREEGIPIEIKPFEANLPAIGPSGCVPFTFTLADSSSTLSPVISYNWTIGNPEIFSSSQMNPTFTLPDTGHYDIQLILENQDGCIDTIVKENYISTGFLPEVEFFADPLIGCLDVEKSFFNQSTGITDYWEWYFGGDFASFEENPIIEFGDPGSHDIMLIAGHNGCRDTLIKPDYVTILAPVSKFEIDYNCDDPYSVDLLNGTLGADSLMWTIHYSEMDSINIPDSLIGTFNLPDRGKYAIKHYAINYSTGCEHTKYDTIRIVDPIASYALDTLDGCAPLTLEISDLSQDAFNISYYSGEGVLDTLDIDTASITFNEGGLIPGPTMIITDIHECRDTFTYFDSVFVNKLVASADFTEIICVPEIADLSSSSTVTFAEITSWNWDINEGFFNASTPDTSLTIDSVGLYDVYLEVEDSWGCVDSILYENAINAVQVVPNFDGDTLGCTFAPIDFVPLGVTPNVGAYYWEFGDGQTSDLSHPSHFYDQEGIYSVCLTMYDVGGCGKTICKENFVEIKDPVADFYGDPIFATCPPLLSEFFNNSTNANSSIWDFGDNSGLSQLTDPSHVFTQPGSFDISLVVEMTPKCRDTLLLPDYVVVKGPTAQFVPDIEPSCIPIAVSLYGESDGAYSYVWDYGNGVLDSVSGLVVYDTTSFFYDEPGRFTPKLIVTDSIGCSRSFAGDPIEINEATIDFTASSVPFCGPPLDIMVENLSQSTTENIYYSWELIGPETVVSNEEQPTFTINESGIYDVNLIVSFDDCIDTLTQTDLIEIAEIPDIDFNILANQLCADVEVEFENNSSVGYGEIVNWFWEFGDGDTSTVESPQHAYDTIASYSITLTGITDKGCENSFSSSFDVLPSTIALAGTDTTICIGDVITLSSEVENLLEGGDFYWESNPTLSCTDCYTPEVAPTEDQAYVFVAIHPNGCESKDTLNVTVIPTPGPELSLVTESIICLGSETHIDIANYDDNYQYVWDQSVPGLDCYINCETVNVTPSELTTYSVTVYNEFGCRKTESITVDVESEFVDFLTETKGICEGESTTISLTAGSNPVWNESATIDCQTCMEVVVNPQSTTIYYATVESALGCEYLDSIIVEVVPDGAVEAGLDREICLGETIVLEATGYGNATWEGDGLIANPADLNTDFTPNASGPVMLTMIYDECVQADELFVTVHEKADIEAVGDTICVGEVANVSSYGRADQYEWYVDDVVSSGQELLVNPELSTDYMVIGKYRICTPDTAYASVYVHPKIEYTLDQYRYRIYLNDQIDIDPTYDINRNYSFSWFPLEGLDCTDCPAPIIKGIMEDIIYDLIIVDENTGCEAETLIDVRFSEDCNQEIFYRANIFSPNGDGINDEFKVKTRNPDEFIKLQIFDRWGSLLFTTTDIDEGWNGEYNGSKLQPGVYVYRLDMICPATKEEYVLLGDVTIVK